MLKLSDERFAEILARGLVDLLEVVGPLGCDCCGEDDAPETYPPDEGSE